MISVQVLAASAVTRAGLEAIVRSNGAFAVAGDVSTADVALLAAAHLTEEIAAHPVPVVLLTDDSIGIERMARTAVRAILAPEATAEEIAAAIHAVAAGLIAIDPAALHRPASDNAEEPLTPREIEVLTMLADGLSNKAIAHRLGISDHTAKFHVAQILAKLNAASRTEAVTQGIRRGLILI